MGRYYLIRIVTSEGENQEVSIIDAYHTHAAANKAMQEEHDEAVAEAERLNMLMTNDDTEASNFYIHTADGVFVNWHIVQHIN